MLALVGSENDLLIGELYEGAPLANFDIAQVMEQVAGLVNAAGGPSRIWRMISPLGNSSEKSAGSGVLPGWVSEHIGASLTC